MNVRIAEHFSGKFKIIQNAKLDRPVHRWRYSRIFVLNFSRQLSKFVEHKKVCHADIQTGLTFNGTDLGCRGASQLEETLKVSAMTSGHESYIIIGDTYGISFMYNNFPGAVNILYSSRKFSLKFSSF